MRDVRVERDGEWLVLVTIRRRRDRPEKRSQMYLSTDEAAIMCELLKRELPEVTVSRTDARRPEA